MNSGIVDRLTREVEAVRGIIGSDWEDHVEKGAKTKIGDVVNWAGTLYVRVKDVPGGGDKVNFKKLGKSPAGWQKGDDLPSDLADKKSTVLSDAGEKDQTAPTAKPSGSEEEKKPKPKGTGQKGYTPFHGLSLYVSPKGNIAVMDDRDYKEFLTVGGLPMNVSQLPPGWDLKKDGVPKSAKEALEESQVELTKTRRDPGIDTLNGPDPATIGAPDQVGASDNSDAIYHPLKTANFTKDTKLPKKLNGIPLQSWSDHPKTPEEWNKVKGQNDVEEPPFPEKPGFARSSGCLIEEPDGRVWLVSPRNAFGGYKNTFPKGRVDPGLNPQANAIKEVWEESGLQVTIIDFIKDVQRTTSVTRYYKAKRVGGTPLDFGDDETEGVRLVPKSELKQYLNKEVDHQLVAKSLTEWRDRLEDILLRVEKGKKTKIGDVVNWAGTLYVRIKDIPGAGDKVNFKKLGKAPAGWQKGDGLPDNLADKKAEVLSDAGETDQTEDVKFDPDSKVEWTPDAEVGQKGFLPGGGLTLFIDQDGFIMMKNGMGEAYHTGLDAVDLPDDWDIGLDGVPIYMKDSLADAQNDFIGHELLVEPKGEEEGLYDDPVDDDDIAFYVTNNDIWMKNSKGEIYPTGLFADDLPEDWNVEEDGLPADLDGALADAKSDWADMLKKLNGQDDELEGADIGISAWEIEQTISGFIGEGNPTSSEHTGNQMETVVDMQGVGTHMYAGSVATMAEEFDNNHDQHCMAVLLEDGKVKAKVTKNPNDATNSFAKMSQALAMVNIHDTDIDAIAGGWISSIDLNAAQMSFTQADDLASVLDTELKKKADALGKGWVGHSINAGGFVTSMLTKSEQDDVDDPGTPETLDGMLGYKPPSGLHLETKNGDVILVHEDTNTNYIVGQDNLIPDGWSIATDGVPELLKESLEFQLEKATGSAYYMEEVTVSSGAKATGQKGYKLKGTKFIIGGPDIYVTDEDETEGKLWVGVTNNLPNDWDIDVDGVPASMKANLEVGIQQFNTDVEGPDVTSSESMIDMTTPHFGGGLKEPLGDLEFAFAALATPTSDIRATTAPDAKIVSKPMSGGSTGAKSIRAKFKTHDGKDVSLNGVFKKGGASGIAHAKEENTANALYRAVGMDASVSCMVDVAGEQGVYSQWLDGKLMVDLNSSEREEAKAQLSKGFAMDALLGNWDVVGQNMDNIIKVGDRYHRIDNGGALRYRAQGATKGADFGTTVKELDSMRQSGNSSGDIFGHLTDDQVVGQVRKLLLHRDKIVSTAKERSSTLANLLDERLNSMEEWADTKSGKQPASSEAKMYHPVDNPFGPRLKGGFTAAERQSYANGTKMPTAKAEHKTQLKYYQGNGYGIVNKTLRDRMPLTGKVKDTVDALDDYMSATPKQHYEKMVRAVGPQLLQNIFSGLSIPDIDIMGEGDLDTVIPETGETKREMFESHLVGAVFSELNYGSSSFLKTSKKPKGKNLSTYSPPTGSWAGSNRVSAKNGADLQIAWKGNTRGADFNEIPGYSGGSMEHEQELVLPRNTRHRITGVEFPVVNGKLIVRLHTELVEAKGDIW